MYTECVHELTKTQVGNKLNVIQNASGKLRFCFRGKGFAEKN